MRHFAFCIAGVLSVTASPSRAQEPATSARHFTFALGPLLLAQRDANASPLRYTGHGAFLQADYTTRSDLRSLTVRIGGATGALRSSLTGPDGLPRQETYRGWVEVEYARGPTGKNRRTRVYVGGLLVVHGTGVLHTYDTPTASQGGTAFFAARLGPVVAVERAVAGRATLSARLGVSALAIVGHPYGTLNRPDASLPDLHLHITSVTAFQAADFTAAYALPLGSAGTIAIRHHLVVERYAGPPSFRFASQGLAFTLDLRLGRGGP